jgi:hypothetical protein
MVLGCLALAAPAAADDWVIGNGAVVNVKADTDVDRDVIVIEKPAIPIAKKGMRWVEPALSDIDSWEPLPTKNLHYIREHIQYMDAFF